MNLTDYPTPKSDAAANSCFGGDETVDADISRKLEREAAAWREMAEWLVARVRRHQHVGVNVCESCRVIRAFDALESQLEEKS